MLSHPWPKPFSKRLRTKIALQPAFEPVTVEDYVKYLRIQATPDPVVVTRKLRAARKRCEEYAWRSFVSQQRDGFMELPPGTFTESFASILARFFGYVPESLALPYPPHLTVDGVFLTDDAGNETQVDPSVFWVSRADDPKRIALQTTAVWPDTGGRTFEVFRIRFTAGYAVPFTADPTTGILTAPRHGKRDGDQVVVRAYGGNLPGGLDGDPQNGAAYYVINANSDASGNTLQLSATAGGVPIVLDSSGDGAIAIGEVPDHFCRAILATAGADFYDDHKGKIPEGVESLPDIARELLAFEPPVKC